MSWYYLKRGLESLPCSREREEESLEVTCLGGEPLPPLKSKTTHAEFYYKGKLRESYLNSLSGTMCKHSRGGFGGARLMSSQEVSRAKTSVLLEKEPESKEQDHPCGNTWRELYMRFDPDTASLRTHQHLFTEDLEMSSQTYPKWGMMRNGVLWERITLPPLTGATGSGSWATPTTMDTLPPKSEKALLKEATEARPGRSKPANLRDQVSNMENWPTPCARDWKGANAVEGLVRNDGKSRMDQLANAVAHRPVNWPTPRCFMHKDALVDRGKSNLGEVVNGLEQVTKGGQLNPDWVEWLMGWPVGWTDLKPMLDLQWRDWQVDPAEDGSIGRVAEGVENRKARLKAIGNGQVPQVAVLAWKNLKGE